MFKLDKLHLWKYGFLYEHIELEHQTSKKQKNRKTAEIENQASKNTLLGARATVVKRLVGHWYSTEALVQ